QNTASFTALMIRQISKLWRLALQRESGKIGETPTALMYRQFAPTTTYIITFRNTSQNQRKSPPRTSWIMKKTALGLGFVSDLAVCQRSELSQCPSSFTGSDFRIFSRIARR